MQCTLNSFKNKNNNNDDETAAADDNDDVVDEQDDNSGVEENENMDMVTLMKMMQICCRCPLCSNQTIIINTTYLNTTITTTT